MVLLTHYYAGRFSLLFLKELSTIIIAYCIPINDMIPFKDIKLLTVALKSVKYGLAVTENGESGKFGGRCTLAACLTPSVQR